MKLFYNEPIFFEKNRVARVYTGGKLFSEFFGDDSEDGFFPEEWVVSTVHALNEGSKLCFCLNERLVLITKVTQQHVSPALQLTKLFLGISVQLIAGHKLDPVEHTHVV